MSQKSRATKMFEQKAALRASRPTEKELEEAVARIVSSDHVYLVKDEEEDVTGEVFSPVTREQKTKEVVVALAQCCFFTPEDPIYDEDRMLADHVLDSFEHKWKRLGGRDTESTVSGLAKDLVLVPWPYIDASISRNDPEDDEAAAESVKLNQRAEAAFDKITAKLAKAAQEEALDKALTEAVEEDEAKQAAAEPGSPPASPASKRARDSDQEQSPSKKPKPSDAATPAKAE